ncbi:hypothetical protein JVY00_18205 [Tsukamurella tyrosinosolvens]|uniref:HEPN domain-containing protein n=1 Tax=Tsukamurella tyrosinosolvens TaxID=57704 RepID=UPI001AF1ABED|nr:HEPN domain-containing protein [Tsukamurella tyrosinosolvens]QRY83756.1 hypothetical protein JVY00_18205 [Tsukamurella tyrosinosolvens]
MDPIEIFRELINQVNRIQTAASAGDDAVSAPLFRSALVLTVAAIDTYVHEIGTIALNDHWRVGDRSAICDYLNFPEERSADDALGADEIRYALSSKTLVSPQRIEELVQCCGQLPSTLWRSVAIKNASKPGKIKTHLQLVYDRRNQIAHAGDWNPVEVEFYPISSVNVDDCKMVARQVVYGIDSLLKP